MTAHDEALALLRERFPEPWDVLVHEPERKGAQFVAAAFTPGDSDVQVHGYADDTLSAARACISAWDEATDDEALRAGEALAATLEHKEAELAAERQLSDRLAEALELAEPHVSRYCVIDRSAAENALASWRERRGK